MSCVGACREWLAAERRRESERRQDRAELAYAEALGKLQAVDRRHDAPPTGR